MPSQLHESHLLLFRNQPTLAAELIRVALGARVPAYREARVISADLTDVQPTEYRADLVVEFSDGASVLGIIVEVQLSVDERKEFVWPVYVATLRARLRCPVCLLVVTASESVARWAAEPVQLGGENRFAPYVLGPSDVPEILDEADAHENPELAVLSAMAHGRDADTERSARVAFVAQSAIVGLDADRSKLYFDLIVSCLSEAARQALKSMDAQTYEYQSDFARHYVAQGEANGRATLIAKLLATKFGVLTHDVQTRIHAASIAELETMGVRLLAAATLQEVLP